MKQTLYLIDNRSHTDPRLNLALEEYVLRYADTNQDYILLSINEPCIVVGRHQNAFQEININYVRKHQIPVLRRISGGGTVYQDTGNLNFSFITNYHKSKFNNYREFTAPFIQALNSRGVPARLNERNDIVINDLKISGNSQFTTKNRMVSHGTLLFDSDLNAVRAALDTPSEKFQSKARKSIPSKITNIAHHLQQQMNISDFKKLIINRIFGHSTTPPLFRFSANEWAKIRELAESKYDSWEWNYGESPQFSFANTKQFPAGTIKVHIEVNKGIVQQLQFTGNGVLSTTVEELEAQLTNIRYQPDTFRAALQRINLTRYFHHISSVEILHLLF